MADKKVLNQYLPGDIPYDTGDEYPHPRRDADRYVCLGATYRDAYADDLIYYDREHDRFVQDIYTWGVVDDADHRYHGMKIRDREYVSRNTYYPSKVFAEILGTMPDEYYKPPKPSKLEPEKPKEKVLLVWPAIRSVMKTYYKLGDTDDREVADYYREMLEYAREEIREARSNVPDIEYYLAKEESDGMLDQLIAHMGEASIYDLHIDKDSDLWKVFMKVDNVWLFPNVLYINIVGLLINAVPAGQEFELYIETPKKYEEVEDLLKEVFDCIEDEFADLRPIKYRFIDGE